MIEKLLSLFLEPESLAIVMIVIIIAVIVGYLLVVHRVFQMKSEVLLLFMPGGMYEVLERQERDKKRVEVYKKFDNQMKLNGFLQTTLVNESEHQKQVLVSEVRHVDKEYILNIKNNGSEVNNEVFSSKKELEGFLEKNTNIRFGDFIAR